ncbi:MAG TPA: hypothetical protein VH374_08740 [Polyangia bacterium]|nr:hypothetical protein [Polyangia bacterium]
MSIYPDGFFSRACHAIFVCGSLILDDARAGGTYGPAWIILVASAESGVGGIFKTAHLGVHHEFSSLIWQKFPDLIKAWQPLMPVGWQPARDNAEALAAAETGSADPAAGFLTPYGRTSLENDFNVYAETAFAEPTLLRDLGRTYQVVAKKAGLLVAAYTALDDRMHDVFAKLELAQFGSAFPQTLSEGYAVPAPTTMPQPSIVDHSETRTLKRKKP